MRIAVAVAIALLSTSAIVQAQDPKPRFELNIARQALDTALKDLAQQTGLQIARLSDAVDGSAVVGPVSGTRTAEEALQSLLGESGLTYKVVNERTIAVVKVGEELPVSSVSETGENAIRLAQGEMAGTASPEEGVAGQPSENQEAKLEEIVVTAQKRVERLQDVPRSITAITAADIDRRGLVNAEDYLRGIPGVNQTDSATGQSVVIRGMETAPENQNFASGATTATYFGETPTTNASGLGAGTNVDLKLVDITRVEVLRGPQGTAFGNSSVGGAVRIIPTPPNLERLEGKVGAGYSGTSGNGGDNHNAQAVANLPLIKDKVAVRAVAYQYQDSGFYRNRAGSNAAFQTAVVTRFGAEAFAVDKEEVGSYSATGGRMSALIAPTDDLRFTLSYLSQETETDGAALANSGDYEQTGLQVAPEHVVRGEEGGVLDTDIDLANATAEYDLGWANLLATYSHVESGSVRALPFQIDRPSFPISSDLDSSHREHVTELRLLTQLDGAWNFLGGVYFEDVKDDALFDFRWFGDPARDLFAPGQQFLGTQRHEWELKQKAAFGEASWEFLPGMTFTGGVRAYDYDRTVAVEQIGPFFNPTTPTTLVSTSNDSDASGTNFRANLSYKLGDLGLVYGGWSQGFRLGKPQAPLTQCDRDGDGNIDGASIPVESTGRFKSDGVDSYELGGKFALLDRRLTVDATLFRMDWSDIPVSVVAGSQGTGCGLLYVTNAGEAQSEGVEVQTNIYVTRAFRVDVGGSWIDAKLTKDAQAVSAQAGDRLPGSPKVNANLSLQYEFNIGGHEAYVRADSIYVGPFFGNLVETPNTRSGDYVKLDASARLKIRNLNVDLYVRNLTNEDAFTFRGIATAARQFTGYQLRPRTIGLQVGYNFE